MKENYKSEITDFNVRVLIALAVLFAGVFLACGSVQAWVARYNGPLNGYDAGGGIAVDSLGNVYVSGASRSVDSNESSNATIKYNSAGQQQWIAHSNGGGAVAVDGSGNVYVAGSSGNLNTFDLDYTTIKYNSAGQQLWVAQYDGPAHGYDDLSAMAIDSSGNVYVTGTSGNLDTLAIDYVTIKYNSAGQRQWVATYNGTGNFDDWASGIAVDSSGNVYVTGQSSGTGCGCYDAVTIKYNSAGQRQWVARYNGPAGHADSGQAVAIDGSGNVYVTGYADASTPHSGDYVTIKYNSTGQQQWVALNTERGNAKDGANGIAVRSTGNFYVTGRSEAEGTLYDYATIKYNSTGQQQWVARYNGTGNFDDEFPDIAIDSSENV